MAIKATDKDLFDDSTMTFGEHLEALRTHLFRAIIALIVGFLIALYFSPGVLLEIQKPVTHAMQKHFGILPPDADLSDQPTPWERFVSWTTGKPLPVREKKVKPAADITILPPTTWDKVVSWTTGKPPPVRKAEVKPPADKSLPLIKVEMEIDSAEVGRQLHALDSKYPEVKPDAKGSPLKLVMPPETLQSLLAYLSERDAKPRTDTVDEAFMIYLKVALVIGAILSSPYVFYEMWMFVSAGLYMNERKYVYIYMPLSLALFFGGVLLCFFAVIPIVLDFLFEFNKMLDLRPEMKISSWISFVTILPLMFGVSFQLPLVMLFLERVGIIPLTIYRTYRRHSILVIAIISMVLTPSDPISMMLMMIPLTILYELGIWLCRWNGPSQSPFAQPA